MKDNRKLNKQDIDKQLKSVDTELKDGVFTFSGQMTIGEFSNKINISSTEIITKYFKEGKMFNINHTLGEEEIAELCLDYGFDFQKEHQIDASNFMDEVKIQDHDDDLINRSPIVTIMGHVDHGKTTLIDKIRKSEITKSEAGGITQHIGAYQIFHKDKSITFLDTPGHEAFSAMRARGANLTDIVILVVAADDLVMPQTKEAIDHSKAADVPIIVFVNKMDKPGADPEKIRAELSKHDVLAEEWGGHVQFIEGSALSGDGVDKLLEGILIQAELMKIKANPKRLSIGVVVESSVTTGKGVEATLIVTNGTLIVKDFIVAGSNFGRIRSMKDVVGKTLESAGPSMPVVVTGLNYSPEAGDKFYGFKDEKFAKALANKKAFTDKQIDLKARTTLQIKDGIKVLNIIIKSDVQGTTEAVKYALSKINNDEAIVNIVRASAGVITKSDVVLAQASGAIIYCFNVKPNKEIASFADHERVQIVSYNVIYKMIEDVEKTISGMRAPKYEEFITGEAVVKMVINSSKVGNIAGSEMVKGYALSKSGVRLKRADKVIHEGKLDSLQRGPDQTKKVENGKEFGCHIYKFNNIEEGDILEFFIDQEIKV
ncbi:translation initiation factor IF-2 [Candidatus Mycoplasma mahonii]|uniref:translation initiation factor IF-2 n=1 Tax=Candidatus Mycoplasma mahonii TaxID=3004105 RepID=UPI0026EC4F22|nr:translation initiation factor IF-2 [Candidatus Mycoplasma mahonii]WKX02537.1 translation initiation factor IF-2 [Candidatus Mycoplasma mahonii]